MEIWIIVHISEPIAISEECDTRWWDLLVGIEIPVVIIYIISMIIENIPLVKSE